MKENDGWNKKKKGCAHIFTHPDSYEGRAIVKNFYGIYFNGEKYNTLKDAKKAALCQNMKNT